MSRLHTKNRRRAPTYPYPIIAPRSVYERMRRQLMTALGADPGWIGESTPLSVKAMAEAVAIVSRAARGEG